MNETKNNNRFSRDSRDRSVAPWTPPEARSRPLGQDMSSEAIHDAPSLSGNRETRSRPLSRDRSTDIHDVPFLSGNPETRSQMLSRDMYSGNRDSRSEPEMLLSLAPMAGYTDEAFRVLCGAFGAEETVTEMVSARALYHNDQKSERLMRTDPSETGVTLQIFGSEPEILAEVTRRVLNRRDDFVCIDINMGCPVPKIVKNGEGAALLRNPDAAARLASAVVEASDKPVSVKIRTGWDHHSKNYLEVGKKLQETGIARLTLHGRTRSQFYTGEADWEAIAELADTLTIPVIGNGDIADVQTALHRIRTTKVRGIAIGRGAVGNPFLFRQIKDALAGKAPYEPDVSERIATALRHLALAVDKKGEELAVVQMRKHLLAYVKGWYEASALKQKVLAEVTQAGVERVFSEYAKRMRKAGEFSESEY